MGSFNEMGINWQICWLHRISHGGFSDSHLRFGLVDLRFHGMQPSARHSMSHADCFCDVASLAPDDGELLTGQTLLFWEVCLLLCSWPVAFLVFILILFPLTFH